MATLKAIILSHQIREDKTYNVKIRVTHNRQSAYISMNYYLTQKQVTRDCKRIKDNFVLSQLDIESALLRRGVRKITFSI